VVTGGIATDGGDGGGGPAPALRPATAAALRPSSGSYRARHPRSGSKPPVRPHMGPAPRPQWRGYVAPARRGLGGPPPPGGSLAFDLLAPPFPPLGPPITSPSTIPKPSDTLSNMVWRSRLTRHLTVYKLSLVDCSFWAAQGYWLNGVSDIWAGRGHGGGGGVYIAARGWRPDGGRPRREGAKAVICIAE
jgi:hypothetical protein